MSFSIELDYRFDSSGFFDAPERRATLEAAAAEWEMLIRDDFAPVPVGAMFEITDPSNGSITRQITVTEPVSDIVIFVGARSLPGNSAAIAGPSGYDLSGDIFRARISDDFRGGGAVSDFEPWTGTVSFDTLTNWHFTMAEPPANKLDLFTVAVHEIAHVLGIGTSGAFDALISGGNTPIFNGVNSTALNGGNGIPLDPAEGHVAEGFANDIVVLDPTLASGTRMRPSEYDKAILADIGYDIAGFVKQGTVPPIATNSGETIFGTDQLDVIDGLGGNDQIQTGLGDDVAFGGAGVDSLFGGEGDDTLNGGAEGDQVSGNAGNDVLNGDDGNDLLFGDTGADTISGGDGNDQIQGGDGNDVIRGSVGADSIFGEAGTDIFEFSLGDGADEIFDFDLNGEIIRFINSGFDAVADALAAISKPFSNVSRITLSDGSFVNVFHDSQAGSPLTANHIEVLTDVGPGNSAPSGAVTIIGDARLGSTLSADISTIADADGLGAFSFTWLRDGIETGNATANYLLEAADLGGVMTVRVGYLDGRGTSESLTSAPTTMVQNVNSPAMGSIIIQGTGAVGNTLSADITGVSDPDGLLSAMPAYQWLRGGAEISGATQATYVLAQSDSGADVSVRLQFVDDLGTTETLTSATTSVLATGMVLNGTERDDEIFATAGDDTIDGGDGNDTVVFQGNQASYTLSIGTDGVTVSDRRSEENGGQGTDFLTSVEFLDFGTMIPLYDGPMNLDMIDNPVDLTAEAFSNITELYIAYFNRAPDALGLYFWATVLDAGFSLQQIAEFFFDQDETRATYQDVLSADGRTVVDTEAFITAVYNNVLGRQPDQDGFNFWLTALNISPDVTPPSFILSIINGAKFAADPVPQTFVDQQFLADKAEIGTYFSAIKGLSNVDQGTAAMALFDGSEQSIQDAVTYIDGVFADALDPENGQFLAQLSGVLDDPFAIA